jgi:hypothetical protein
MQLNISDIKSQLNRDDVSSILTSFGYEVSTRDYKFRLRDENTASAIINQDGTIHDYGADYHGDILDTLQQFQNLSFSEALETLKGYIGITENVIVTPRATIEPKKEFISVLSDEVYIQMIETLKWYDSKDTLQSFRNPDYKKEALAICPLWVFKQAEPTALKQFQSLTSYDFNNKTLVIRIHDYQGKLISFKRRRLNAGKWITAKDTHPNKQCLLSIKSDNNHIYIVEGHHDFLTAVLLDIDVLMIPTVNYKSFNEYEISLLKNRDVIFIPDFKEDDLSGVDAMRNLAKQIGAVARNAKVFSLPLFLESESISFTGNKLDLSEVVELWTDGLKSFVSVLEYVADKNIFYISEEIF